MNLRLLFVYIQIFTEDEALMQDMYGIDFTFITKLLFVSLARKPSEKPAQPPQYIVVIHSYWG
jgi:hypothetical protein